MNKQVFMGKYTKISNVILILIIIFKGGKYILWIYQVDQY